MKSLLVIVWLAIIILATSWFFFWPGMFYLHDYLHPARIAEMAGALSDGHFPVRWSENFGYGYGMPLFEFYAPLPFYVGAIFALIGLPVLVVTKLLFILCNIFTTVGAYKLGKSIYGRGGGLVTAASISLAPYRAVNLYVRGALSESWGIMAIVWIIYFLYRTAKGYRHAWIGLTLSLIVLFLSHNLLTLLFVPFSILIGLITLIYAYFSHRPNFKKFWQKSTLIAYSYVLAVGVSAFYIFPAYTEKSLTQLQSIIVGGYFDYSLHFVYLRQFFYPHWGYGGSNWGPDDGISFFLGYAQLITLTLSLLSMVFVAKQLLIESKSSIYKPRWWWFAGMFGLLATTILMSTEKTAAVWHAIPLLQFAQFPWRFLSIALVLIGVVSPFFLLIQQSFIKRWILGWFFFLLFFANLIYFRPESFIDSPQKYFTGNPNSIQNELSSVLPDYLPSGASLTVPPTQIATCSGLCESFEIIQDKVHTKLVAVIASEPSEVVFAINYFPGWYATVDGQKVEIVVKNGLIVVPVSSGKHQIHVQFGSTRVRYMSDMLSLSSIILLGLSIIISKRRVK